MTIHTVASNRSLQSLLEIAQPGDRIKGPAGTFFAKDAIGFRSGSEGYMSNLLTVRAGMKDKPIVLDFDPAFVLRGGGTGRFFMLAHSHYIIQGGVFDGYQKDGDPWQDPSIGAFNASCLYIQPLALPYLEGIQLLGTLFKNGGGELIRYKLTNGIIVDGVIFGDGGMTKMRTDTTGKVKNGEGIYGGTSPKPDQLAKNPTNDLDTSADAIIRNCRTLGRRYGGDCINIKEASHHNLIEGNVLFGCEDPSSAVINVQGENNIIRNNIVGDSKGHGIRHGTSSNVQGLFPSIPFAGKNDILNNTIVRCVAGPIKTQTTNPGRIEGNTGDANGAGMGDEKVWNVVKANFPNAYTVESGLSAKFPTPTKGQVVGGNVPTPTAPTQPNVPTQPNDDGPPEPPDYVDPNDTDGPPEAGEQPSNPTRPTPAQPTTPTPQPTTPSNDELLVEVRSLNANVKRMMAHFGVK